MFLYLRTLSLDLSRGAYLGVHGPKEQALKTQSLRGSTMCVIRLMHLLVDFVVKTRLRDKHFLFHFGGLFP